MKVYAHRGLHDGEERLENTRKAVEDALASSAEGLEVDLQLLSDGRFLLYHDDKLNPKHFEVTRPIPLATLTLQEVRAVSTVDLLTLSELLELDGHGKTLVLECKASRNRFSFARALERILLGQNDGADWVFSTQDWSLLYHLRHRLGDRSLAPVLGRLNPMDRHRARDDRWNELHLDQNLCTEELLKDTNFRADRIVAWTVNDPEKAQKLERLGIKGIMTDNLDLFP